MGGGGDGGRGGADGGLGGKGGWNASKVDDATVSGTMLPKFPVSLVREVPR